VHSGRPVGSKGSRLSRVPLVPRSTRGYFLATTPWFVVGGSAGGGVDQRLEGFLVKALRFLANEVSGVCVQKRVNRRDAFKDFSFVREEFAARANFLGQGVDGRFHNGSKISGNYIGRVAVERSALPGSTDKGAGYGRLGTVVENEFRGRVHGWSFRVLCSEFTSIHLRPSCRIADSFEDHLKFEILIFSAPLSHSLGSLRANPTGPSHKLLPYGLQ